MALSGKTYVNQVTQIRIARLIQNQLYLILRSAFTDKAVLKDSYSERKPGVV